MSSLPAVAIAITCAPRARVSWMFEMILSYTWMLVATTTTGVPSSSSAIGPCFISPAENAVDLLLRQGLPDLGKPQCEQAQQRHLSRERLRRSHADLDSAAGVERRV